MELAPLLGSHSPKIEKIVERTGDAKPTLDQSAMSAPRGKRKSKVIETILETLGHSQASAAELRAALASAGMAVSSLSTGLAILQKSGQIQRDGHGTYFLSAHEGAEAA